MAKPVIDLDRVVLYPEHSLAKHKDLDRFMLRRSSDAIVPFAGLWQLLKQPPSAGRRESKALSCQGGQRCDCSVQPEIGRVGMESKHEFILSWSEEDDMFVVDVPFPSRFHLR